MASQIFSEGLFYAFFEKKMELPEDNSIVSAKL